MIFLDSFLNGVFCVWDCRCVRTFQQLKKEYATLKKKLEAYFQVPEANLFVFFFYPQKKLLCVFFFFTDEIWRCFWCYSAGKTSWAHRVCLSSQIIACKWINGKCGAKMWEMLVVYVKKRKRKSKSEGRFGWVDE